MSITLAPSATLRSLVEAPEFMSFSQYAEDEAFVPLLPDDGSVLDLGAWSAEKFSNSRALIKKGWRAVLVEPSPGPLKWICEFYRNDPRVQIVGAAVATTAGMIEIQLTDDAVSTSDPGNFQVWDKSADFYGRAWFPAITLADILNRFGSFDCVNIDVEGQSVPIAVQLMNTEMYPKVIIVEHDKDYELLMKTASRRGYRQLDVNPASEATNTVLVR